MLLNHVVDRPKRCPRAPDVENLCAWQKATHDRRPRVIEVDDTVFAANHAGRLVEGDTKRPTRHETSASAGTGDTCNLHRSARRVPNEQAVCGRLINEQRMQGWLLHHTCQHAEGGLRIVEAQTHQGEPRHLARYEARDVDALARADGDADRQDALAASDWRADHDLRRRRA